MFDVFLHQGYYYIVHVYSNKTWKYRYLHADMAYMVRDRLIKSWMRDPGLEDYELRNNINFLKGDEVCKTVGFDGKIEKRVA